MAEVEEEMKHIDLFSGIGGFALAARWAGFETVQFVEIDTFCQKVLAKNFPGVPIHDDIKTFKYSANDTAINELSSPFLLTGGFPCQPFSCAGKRRGKEDDRFLWPEMLRVVSEAKPTWVIGENVAGFINMGLDDCISDLENQGYKVQAFIIPACAVNAPHRRDRVWIVANLRGGGLKERGAPLPRQESGRAFTRDTDCPAPHAPLIGCGSRRAESAGFIGRVGADGADRPASDSESGETQPAEPGGLHSESCGQDSDVADSDRFNGDDAGYDAGEVSQKYWNEPWLTAATRLCRVDARISNRVDRLKSLGNAIVPQVAYEIMKAIRQVDTPLIYY